MFVALTCRWVVVMSVVLELIGFNTTNRPGVTARTA